MIEPGRVWTETISLCEIIERRVVERPHLAVIESAGFDLWTGFGIRNGINRQHFGLGRRSRTIRYTDRLPRRPTPHQHHAERYEDSGETETASNLNHQVLSVNHSRCPTHRPERSSSTMRCAPYTFSSASIIPRESTETARDRKSTRLNSSHVAISYAVFCLKKKKKRKEKGIQTGDEDRHLTLIAAGTDTST